METSPAYTSEEIKGRAEEAALIAACLRRPQIFQDMREIVTADNFDYAPYRDAWKSMAAMAERGDGIDPITLGDELFRVGRLNDWGCHDDVNHTGRLALSFLREKGLPVNARTYAETVRDYANKRQIQEIMSMGAIWALNGRRSADILADLEKRLSAITVIGQAAKHTVTLVEAIKAASDDTDKASHGNNPFVLSGYPDLDRLLDGFCPPDFTLIAGRPGSGKTALLASIVDNVMRKHKRVAFFSLEMDNKQVAMRLISMRSGVPFSKQRTGKMDDTEWTRYYAAIEDLSDSGIKLYLNDLPAISPNRIRQELRRIGEVDLVVVDYLQLQRSDIKTDNRVLEVGYISRSMKEIAKEFCVPVISAAQLSRAGDARADKVPMLSDLRESGSLEQDADNVIFIHREDMESTSAKIVLAKHRNGPTGMCTLTYIGSKTRFESQTGITR
jgi:replicative DNA helicase